jgi:hypothetical protein
VSADLRIINADATPDEIAAIVALFSALGRSAPPKKPVSVWSAHGGKLRTSLPHGRGGWRSSALPR